MIHKIKRHERDYLVLSKDCLQDKEISWKAKGLHSYLISLPDDWVLNLTDLSERSSDGRVSTAGAINELISKGYMTRSQSRDDKGKMSVICYEAYETPLPAVSRFPACGLSACGEPTTTKDTLETKDTQDINKNTSTNSIEIEDKPFSQEEKRLKAVQDVLAGNENSSLAELSGESWSRVVAAMWKERYGGSIQGWTLKFIKPLVKEYGLDTVRKALKTYFDQQEPKFISLKSFSEKFGFWASGGIKTKKRSEDFI